MEGITITINTLLAGLGIITALGGATAVISRWMSPYRTLKKTVDRHTDMLEMASKRLTISESTNRVLCSSILALLDHEITNNSIDKLKAAKEKLQQHLIEN